MPPPDETTPLVPVARPLNWRRKCCKFFHWSRYFVYFLLLLVDLVGLIMFVVVNIIVKSTDFYVYYVVGPIVFNFVDALICWIFLGIVTRSPRFVGCFTVLKNLICLPKFWTLMSVLVLYILGVAIALWQFFSSASQNKDAKIKAVAVMGVVIMEVLNVFTKVALVGVLNYVQIRNVARSRFKYRLLKGSLVVIWLFQMYTLIAAVLIVFLSFILPIATGEQVGLYDPINLIQFFSLPIITRIAELIFTKILQDNKCIIGKNENNVSDESNESNSFTRQPNPCVSNAIETLT